MSNILEAPERRAYSVREAAQMCGLSRATMYKLLSDGRLATIKVGARRLVTEAAIDRLLSGGAQSRPMSAAPQAEIVGGAQ